ncbi:phosphatidylglycerophosphatase A [Bacillus sp. FJAT-27225]|uniref:phosphatidylglycerophosphatase A family protein n=1 Tax=Bacillus sp. FJAT-27225 TaxID=1743144 RepID=UPI00080C2611|nr:phosphatidylglycerophosphatase A [Bacillus sp. FJAT-27225]OCA84227.1 phosphatidylglycerophosphatase A [Bacillus sp. FJAT-27225]
MTRVNSRVVTEAARNFLLERGVSIESIAAIVFEMQVPYHDGLTIAECMDSVEKVLLKREIQHAILVGVELDRLAEQKKLSEPLQSIIEGDEGLFGIDETIAFGATLGYGSIAVTTFGHLDKNKIGIIKELDTGTGVHTFLDDIVASIAATAASRLAHRKRDWEEAQEELEADLIV